MNLNHLSIFRAVATCSSVSGGALRLHISQSAVSKQLGEFERNLDLVLFDRLPRGVKLTEAGKVLLGYANRLFAIEAEAKSALVDLQQLTRGRLSIGASRTVGGYLLPSILAEYHRQYPKVELSLQVENTRTIENKLIAGEIDIGFEEGIVSNELLDYRIFTQDQLVLIAAPRHAVATHHPISLSALKDVPLLMHEVGSGTRAVTEKALASKNIEVRPAMTLASTEAIKQTVATGIGLAFLSSSVIRTELRAKTLTVVQVKGLNIRRPLYQVQLQNTSRSPALDAFLDLLTKHSLDT